MTKYISSMMVVALFVGGQTVSFAQTNAAGYFTSEANIAASDDRVFVSIKKYNPTQSEIDNAAKPSRNSPMNYLMAPFEATNISMYNKGFESKLYALDKAGKPIWETTLGYSEKSSPSPMQLYKGFVFTGEAAQDADKVVIQKIDMTGKVVWKTALDSLNNANAIYVDDNRVSVLVSFDVSKKITHGDGTFSEKVYPIYFFVQLDMTTGKRIVSEYQKMANYLSSLGYANPLLNSDYSYYLSNKDSAIFLNVTKLESATVVTQDMNKENTILKMAVGKESYHLLTLLAIGKNKKRYNLINNFYSKSKKTETALPIDYSISNRSFMYKTVGDSVAIIMGNEKNIVICYSDMEGKADLYKRVDTVISPVVGAGIYGGKVYILQVDGRMKPGTIGKLKLDVY